MNVCAMFCECHEAAFSMCRVLQLPQLWARRWRWACDTITLLHLHRPRVSPLLAFVIRPPTLWYASHAGGPRNARLRCATRALRKVTRRPRAGSVGHEGRLSTGVTFRNLLVGP